MTVQQRTPSLDSFPDSEHELLFDYYDRLEPLLHDSSALPFTPRR